MMKKEIPQRAVLAGFFVCFCFFVFSSERRSLDVQQRALDEQARIIAASVWDLDLSHHQAYLSAAAQHNGYKNLAVTGDDGRILYAVSMDVAGFIDTTLEKLGLIRQVTLQSPVVFKGQQIGRLTAVWLNRTIYGYVYSLVLGLLFLTILSLYNRIVRAHGTLEEQVAARTGELETANRALRDSRLGAEEFIEKVNSIILRWKTDGTVTYMNSFGLNFFGYTEAEIIGKNVVGTIVPETESSGRDLAAMIQDIGRNPEKYVNNENENICKAGRRVWVSWTNRVSCDIYGRDCEVLSIGVDVTDRRAAEEKLLRSESLLREAQQISHTGSWSLDLQTKTNSWSDEFFRLLGYEPGEVQPSFELFSKHIHPDDLQQQLERNRLSAIDPASMNPQEYRLIRRDGSLRYIFAKAMVQPDESGQPSQINGIMQDITELKLGEEALRESRERFARMADSIHEGLTIIEQGKIVYANDRVCAMFGIPKDVYMGGSFEPSSLAPAGEKERLEALKQKYSEKKERPESISFWIQRPDGERRYIQSRYVYRTLEHGATHCYIVTTDETDNRAAEESLRQTIEQLRGREQELEAVNAQLKAQEQQLYRANMELQSSNQQLRASRMELEHAVGFLENIYQTSIAGLITTDEKGYIIRVNRAALKILGGAAEQDIIGRHMVELGPQEEPYISVAAHVMTEMREQGFIHDQETSFVRLDGSLCPVEFNGAYLHNDQGDIIGSIVSIRDITERQRAEESLRESEERFRALAETSPDAIFTTDESMRIVFWNAAAGKIFGYTQQEMLGQSADVLIPKSQMGLHRHNRRLLLETGISSAYGRPVESTAVRKDGTEFSVEVSLTSWRLRGRTYFSTILRDITERKRVEQDLRESEERFRALAETSPDAIFTTDENMTIVFWNAAAERIFGYTRDEILGRPADPVIPKKRMPQHQEDRKLILETGQSPAYHGAVESTALRKDGTEFPVEVSMTSWRLHDRRFFGMILRDITERKRAESEIRASNEFMKTMLKASPEIIMATDAHGVITLLSDSAETLFGSSVKETVGQSAVQLMPEDEDSKQKVLDMVGELLEKGFIKNYEFQWRKKDGNFLFTEWNGLLLKDENGDTTGAVSVVRDVTGRKLMEGQIRQAQKMESIGTLAGGIAHDFNNILTAIIGYTEMNMYHAEGNMRVRHNSENVLKAAGRARDLVKQILTFSRPGDEERKPVQLQPIIKEALKMLRASLPASVDMQQSLLSESYAYAAPTHIHQIIVNLCTNAAHAMQERGGILRVMLEDADIDAAAAASISDLKAGQYLRLTVTDTGAGIDPAIIHRIFDPFFTTKESGRGTGMGLAMVYGIVTSYGGTITVASQVGRGSTFEVYIPRIQGAETQENPQEPEAPTGTERVLFVDDEWLIVEAGLAMLQTLGYDVVTAYDPLRAIEIFRENPGSFDLVITDYTMPNMNGFDFAMEIMRLRPGMPVMLCTGYSETMSPEKALAAGIRAFVMKPLSRLELAQSVRQALEPDAA